MSPTARAGEATPGPDPATSSTTAPPSGDGVPTDAGAPPRAFRGPARLRVPELRETSGLAVSRRDPNVLWAINDGGHAPALHALAPDGRALGRWLVDAVNRDWEDLAAFRLDGVPHLLIADTGDNGRRRDEVVLHLVVEPELPDPGTGTAAGAATPLLPARSLRVRYEDGPHDVEAVAVDETTGTVWLLPKEPPRNGRGVAGGAYALALDGGTPSADESPLVARRRTTLADVPRGLVGTLAASVVGVDLEQPTALDLSADGRVACLLTYRRPRCLERDDGESWDEAFARPARALAAHGLEQAEALALAPDGRTLWFTSEGIRPPLRERTLP